MTQDLIEVNNTPAIPGLIFRHFRGASDFPHMVAAITASAEADQVERVATVEDIANSYAHLTNSDPYRDMLFAEVNGEVIGYSRGGWYAEADNGPYLYTLVGFLVPAWRRQGIGQVILRWLESRLREVAMGHPADRTKFFKRLLHNTK